MRYSIRTVTPLTAIPLPLALAAAKTHLRVTGESEDEEITAQIRAAALAIERHTSQVLTERELELVLDGFPLMPEMLVLPLEPVTEILFVRYASAADGTEIQLEPGEFRWADTSADVIRPAFGAAWPRAAAESGSVRVRMRAGYGEGLVPPDLALAVKQLTTWYYDNRAGEGEMPAGIARLCMPYRRVLI